MHAFSLVMDVLCAEHASCCHSLVISRGTLVTFGTAVPGVVLEPSTLLISCETMSQIFKHTVQQVCLPRQPYAFEVLKDEIRKLMGEKLLTRLYSDVCALLTTCQD